jgi:hypothetical protein
MVLVSLVVHGAVPAAAASPPAGAEPILQVDSHGGFVPAEIVQGNLPEVTVTADGRVITQQESARFDQMARLRIARIDDESIQRLLDQADALGLLDDSDVVDYGSPNVTDLTDTTVTITLDGETFSTSVYALGFDPDDLSDEQRANRAALQAFIADVADAAPRRPFHVRRLAVLATRTDATDGKVVAWPLDDLNTAGEPGGLADRCLVVSGDDLDALLPLAKEARWGTRWQSGDREWHLVFRALLPHERTCDDINAT